MTDRKELENIYKQNLESDIINYLAEKIAGSGPSSQRRVNKKSQNVHNFQKAKKDFFDLAGKIKLDKDEVTSFRKESLV